ncbi:ABC transporter substrate-binding protein [Virgibacillus sp. 179-BFC.A HS]|uniref:ABC transporter substrate-binding protein n=1 Tax=Tigheibacillus jepli TaxID=3035914 RepID=A0ABU5CKK8_9BACI|nr:ABC transporter substrate-binding protein [Virgibacillus sp. 179-BFC.A HS]MDY0406377.1 ABC transporter substrate-binding protein [Virgibacillus sp. 179-BFC.A HS]
MKKFSFLFIALASILAFTLAGCSNDNPSSVSGAKGDSGKDKTNIELWHSLSGDNGKNFEKIVDEFNKQSDDVHVKAVYQGGYTDTITKIRAVGDKEVPALLQASGTNRKYLAESDFVKPMQDFIDDEKFDTSGIEENVLNRYTIDDKLYSMPFSSSNAIMLYNKDMFKEVGLDPESAPATYEDIEVASKKIKDKTGNVGFSFATIGWYFEELLANQGELYLDQDNGFSGKPTKTLVNEEGGQKIFKWLDKMNKVGTFKNYGSNYEDPRAPFLAGQLAMYLDSSANVRTMVDQAPFEVGTAPLPVPKGVEPNGATVGGNSMYITNKLSDEEQQAAWEFIKYTVSPKVQAEWAAATGYFPVTKDANGESALTEAYDKYPQMKTAVEVNSNTPATPEMSGPLSDEGEQFRTIIEAAQEQVYEGTDPKKALDDAAKKIDELLE